MSSTNSHPLRYEAGRLVLRPGTRPYMFHMILRGEALWTKGVIAAMARVFADHDVNILQVKTSAIDDKVVVIVFADFKGAEDKVELVSRELRKLTPVESLRVVPPLADGIAVDTVSFPVSLSDERAIIIRKSLYSGFIRGGWERFGAPYAALLYAVGLDAGHSTFTRHASLSPDPGVQVRLAQAFFQTQGFGVLEVVKLDDGDKEATIRVYDSFECELFKGAGGPRSGFVRGLLAGWLAARWGLEFGDIVAREEKCIAKGDPYCEIKIFKSKSQK
ncbi:MAG: ACT domain-containing protein [Infirmifilum sp.]